MSNTANLVLPYLAVGQAQKHVTLNESLRRLDALVQLSVASATTSAQPASPADGAVYIVPSGKSGAQWDAFADWSLGYYRDGAWEQISPREGWLAFVRDTDEALMFTGAAWGALSTAMRVSATDRVLGRSSAGAGAAEEIACTAAGRALMDDADAAAQRTTLGLGNVDNKSSATIRGEITSGNVTTALGYTPVSSAGGGFSGTVDIGSGAETPAMPGFQGLRIRTSGVGAGMMVRRDGFAEIGMSSGGGGAIVGTFTSHPISLYVDGAAAASVDSGALSPAADNSYNLGSGSYRFGVVYAGTGVINTSDAREKTALRTLDARERAAIRRVFQGVGLYQWLGAISEKGAGEARLHAGVTAQHVRNAFEAEGLDATRYALFCSDPVVEAVEIKETVRVQRPKMRQVEREQVEIVDGKPVLRVGPVEEPEIEFRQIFDAEGVAIAPEGEAMLYPMPRFEEVDEAITRRVQKMVLDDRGEPVMRLGVRYDQLFAMALAALVD